MTFEELREEALTVQMLHAILERAIKDGRGSLPVCTNDADGEVRPVPVAFVQGVQEARGMLSFNPTMSYPSVLALDTLGENSGIRSLGRE